MEHDPNRILEDTAVSQVSKSAVGGISRRILQARGARREWKLEGIQTCHPLREKDCGCRWI